MKTAFAVFLIQRLDAGLGHRQQLRIVGHLFRFRVAKVAEQRIEDVRLLVGQKMEFESFDEFMYLFVAEEDGRNDDERSCAFGNAFSGCDSRQQSRSEEHTSELQSRGLISYAVFCL